MLPPCKVLSNTKWADFFTNLHQELTIEILSRLPFGSIMSCKCVCKSWRDLIKSAEFVVIHHSKSTSSMSGLALIYATGSSHPFSIYDELGADGCSIISNFSLPTYKKYHRLKPSIKSSANGLLLLSTGLTNLFICNPITREYIELPPLPMDLPSMANVGFGASKVTGQYKVLIFNAFKFQPCICSLGTGLWRSIDYVDRACMREYNNGTALVNGNLHWLGCDYDVDHYNVHRLLISCFDLETEQLTSFSLPRRHYVGSLCMLSALEGRLCLCDNSSYYDNKIVIWLMSKYGDGNSWTKKFIVDTASSYCYVNVAFLFPVIVCRDSGDILFGRPADSEIQLFFYSKKSRTIQEYAHLQARRSYHSSSRVVNYAPSFLSLKTMGFQNVASF